MAKTITGKQVGDSYYQVEHPSGLTVLLYPKEHCSTTYAIFGTRYGSIDNCFQRSDEAGPESVPEGIAHYLEHKLFESEEGDAFERFSKTGASANAFTSFESTCYLFSTTDQVYQSLEILLDFVQSPYFTEETVRKEQGIIGQEIKMYDDDPQWRVMFNYLKAMYHSHPIREDIAGTVESIAKITPELLYRCYNTFYNLGNMVLAIAGNFQVDKALAVCDKMLKPAAPVTVQRVFPQEPDTIVQPVVEERLSVASPLFQFGFKEPGADQPRSEKDVAATEVLLETLASDASPLFRRLLDQGLVNESSFSYEYFEGNGYATVMFSGESKDPQAVAQAILEEVERFQREGIPAEAFERSKRALYGELVAALNSTGSIANGLVNMHLKGSFSPISIPWRLCAWKMGKSACARFSSGSAACFPSSCPTKNTRSWAEGGNSHDASHHIPPPGAGVHREHGGLLHWRVQCLLVRNHHRGGLFAGFGLRQLQL